MGKDLLFDNVLEHYECYHKYYLLRSSMQFDKVRGSLQKPSFEQKLSFSEFSIRLFFKYASSNLVITIMEFDCSMTIMVHI